MRVLHIGPAKSEAFDLSSLEQQSRATLPAGRAAPPKILIGEGSPRGNSSAPKIATSTRASDARRPEPGRRPIDRTGPRVTPRPGSDAELRRGDPCGMGRRRAVIR